MIGTGDEAAGIGVIVLDQGDDPLDLLDRDSWTQDQLWKRWGRGPNGLGGGPVPDDHARWRLQKVSVRTLVRSLVVAAGSREEVGAKEVWGSLLEALGREWGRKDPDADAYYGELLDRGRSVPPAPPMIPEKDLIEVGVRLQQIWWSVLRELWGCEAFLTACISKLTWEELPDAAMDGIWLAQSMWKVPEISGMTTRPDCMFTCLVNGTVVGRHIDQEWASEGWALYRKP